MGTPSCDRTVVTNELLGSGYAVERTRAAIAEGVESGLEFGAVRHMTESVETADLSSIQGPPHHARGSRAILR